MVLLAEMLTNAQKTLIIVTQMPNVLILLVHFRANVTSVIQVGGHMFYHVFVIFITLLMHIQFDSLLFQSLLFKIENHGLRG